MLVPERCADNQNCIFSHHLQKRYYERNGVTYTPDFARGTLDCVLEIPSISLKRGVYTGTREEIEYDLSIWLTTAASSSLELGKTHYAIYGSNPRTFEGAVLYRSSEGQSFEDILEKMQDAICQIFTQKENEARNGYVMTDYKIYPTEAFPKSSSEPHNLKEVGDEVWRIRTLFIFYKYEGKDFGMTFEQLRDSQGEIWTDENGLTLCTADGSEDAFQMILVKRGDVYLLASPKYFFNEPAAK